jgi:uncharacterized protein
MPTFFDCQRCTACCRWPGEVHVDEAEVSRLAQFLEMNEFEFIQTFTELAQNRRGLVLKNKPNGECVFLNNLDCAVQAVKPGQCRDFPNVWNFPGFERICQAVRREVSDQEYAQLVAHVRKEHE